MGWHRRYDALDIKVCRIISGTVFPAFRNFLTFLMVATEPHAPILRFGDSVHLPLSADVILELCDQRQDAHDELAGARTCVDWRTIQHLELNTLLAKLRYAVEIRGGARQAVKFRHQQCVAFAQILYAALQLWSPCIHSRPLLLKPFGAASAFELLKLHGKVVASQC